MSAATAKRIGCPARVGAALLLTGVADVLLFDQPVGVALLLFGALLAFAVSAVGTAAIGPAKLLLPFGALLPLVEAVSPLSFTVAAAGLAMFALAASGRLLPSWPAVAARLCGFLLFMPFRLPLDVSMWRKARRRAGQAGLKIARAAVWIMPLVLVAVFVSLFGAANPVVASWLSLLDPWRLLDLLDFRRFAFWAPVLFAVWAFLRPRAPRRGRSKMFSPMNPILARRSPALPAISAGFSELIFGRDAVLRSLLLFNLVFAVQTALDAAYLWGGVALPEGLTYAGYAHRGAYPLIATALLAALFVLATMRPGSAMSDDRLIRGLVYVWIAQNVGLVLSSILRLDLYVGIYALTYWRVAAFVWMLLVAAGLVLIILRIAGNRSNAWLIGANLLTLSSTLYACCFINFAALIADFNVEHSREMSGPDGERQALDMWYLASLGPDAVPAIDRFLSHARMVQAEDRHALRVQRNRLAASHRRRMANWRAWTFRDWRLIPYLAAAPPRLRPDATGGLGRR